MLGRVCAVLALAVFALPFSSIPAVEEVAATSPFTKELRSFAFDGIRVTEASLQLSSAEGYPHYYWVLEGQTLLGSGEDSVTAVAGFVEVKRFGTNDLVCRGEVAEFNEVHKHQICDNLRLGHTYVVTYVLSGPATLSLHGHKPFM